MKKLIYSACVMIMMSFAADVHSMETAVFLVPGAPICYIARVSTKLAPSENVLAYLTSSNLPSDVPDGLEYWTKTTEVWLSPGVVMFAGRLTEIAEYAKTAWLHASRTGQPVPPCDLVTLVGGSWKETPVGINKMLDELQKIRPWLLKFACVQTGNPDLLDAYLQTRE